MTTLTQIIADLRNGRLERTHGLGFGKCPRKPQCPSPETADDCYYCDFCDAVVVCQKKPVGELKGTEQ